MRRPPSLRAIAVGWLARREHSERELRRKLLNRLQRMQATAAADAAPSSEMSMAADPAQGLVGESVPRAVDPEVEVEAVIAWLIERGYLDERRFAETRVHVRAPRFGAARIEQELSMHGVELEREVVQALRHSEYERARSVWQRRFGEPAADVRLAARQARFLAGRGFAPDVIRRVLRDANSASNDDD